MDSRLGDIHLMAENPPWYATRLHENFKKVYESKYDSIYLYMSIGCAWRILRHQNSVATPHIVSHLEEGGDNCTNQGKQPPLLVPSDNFHCLVLWNKLWPEILLRYASKLLGWWAAKGTSKSIAKGGMAESLRQHGVAFHPSTLPY